MTNVTIAFENFRKNVADELDRSGMSLRELAQRLQTSHPYVWKVLHGETVPSLDRCEEIAEVLQIPLTSLLRSPVKQP